MEERNLIELVGFPEAIIGLVTEGRYPAPTEGSEPRTFRPRTGHAVYLMFHWPWSSSEDMQTAMDTHSLFSFN